MWTQLYHLTAKQGLYHTKEMVEKELVRLEHFGINKPVTTSKWAAPIVLILKADRKLI